MFAFNATEFSVLGIPPYLFFCTIAATVAICCYIVILTREGVSLGTHLRILFVSLAVLPVSARLFGLLSVYLQFASKDKTISFTDCYMQSGIVFYGGLIGFLISYKIGLRLYNSNNEVFDYVAICIPLFHAIARVGCFTTGCCYGKEYVGVGSVLYTSKIHGLIVTSPRIPIQLIEAVFNLILCIGLVINYKFGHKKPRFLLEKYLLIYGMGRFGLEYLRGDEVRGIWYGYSFSQYISVLLIAIVLGISATRFIISVRRTLQ